MWFFCHFLLSLGRFCRCCDSRGHGALLQLAQRLSQFCRTHAHASTLSATRGCFPSTVNLYSILPFTIVINNKANTYLSRLRDVGITELARHNRPTNGRINNAGCRVACKRLQMLAYVTVQTKTKFIESTHFLDNLKYHQMMIF